MNRYPLWKYILIGIVLIIGLVYTLPNFYGESPAVQVTSGSSLNKAHSKIPSACVLIRLRLKSSFVSAK